MGVCFGITTMALDAPDHFVELVRAVEEGGFDEFWVCDSSLHARDVYVYLSLAAIHSTRLRFGPNCTHPFTRHPAITLNALATLHELSGGRARLAIGAGDRPVTELGYRMAPLRVVREMLGLLTGLQGGEPVTANGAAFALKDARLSFPLPFRVPVYVSASGPRMLSLGGELADGVLVLSGVHPPCIENALEQVRAGMARARRDAGALDVGYTIPGSLREDPALARQECAPMAAWFPQTAPRLAELAGVPAGIAEKIRAAYAGGHFDSARAAAGYVTDLMVERFTIAGPAEVWRERIREVVALGIQHVNIFLLSRDRLGMVRALSREVLPRFSRDHARTADGVSQPRG